MKSKILNFVLVLILALTLFVLTGCAEVENAETSKNESVNEIREEKDPINDFCRTYR